MVGFRKTCRNCGMDGSNGGLFEVKQIDDGKIPFDGEKVVVCGNCMSNLDFFLDFYGFMVR